MSTSYVALQVTCSVPESRPSISNNYDHLKSSSSSGFKPIILLKAMQQVRIEHVSETIKNATAKLLDAFVDSAFEFVDQPLLPSQRNFAPVDELGRPAVITSIEGKIPDHFPEGVYIRNGANPQFGGLKSTKSAFGKSKHLWIEGEGMLHALYFTKDGDDCKWTVHYNNRYVETETFKQEKQRNKPSFFPIIEGDILAVISAALLNLLRFGKINKHVSNTNVFEHSGKLYSVAEYHLPQEIDVSTLQTIGYWNLSRAWNRPFTSHPKRVPGTGELAIIGVNAIKRPYIELGVISADGKKLVHRADLKLGRCTFCHDLGVTQRYNVFMDFPITIDIMRFFQGGPLINYNKKEYARIGVMPRYGDANSIKWFEVEPNCTFHILNCFEDGDNEHLYLIRGLQPKYGYHTWDPPNKSIIVWVVVWGCRALESLLPFGNSVQDELVHNRPYEWRLNMQTREVEEKNLTADEELSMEVPLINENFVGLKNKFGYAQVFDSMSNSNPDTMPKFRGLAKLDFAQLDKKKFSTTRANIEEVIKVEYHMFKEKTFCSGATFVPKKGGLEEDDGWIITFVHNEDTNISQVFIIDTKEFSRDPVCKITLPCRVPYGFHGAFIPISE